LSSYFVLDVTNPEKDPVLLWVFRDKDLGLTTAAPAVLRVNSLTDANTSSANEKWYVVFGTGPTHIDGSSGQTAKMFVVDLKLGPVYTAINQTSGVVGGTACSLTAPCIASDTASASGAVRVFSTGQTGASMGNAITLDSLCFSRSYEQSMGLFRDRSILLQQRQDDHRQAAFLRRERLHHHRRLP